MTEKQSFVSTLGSQIGSRQAALASGSSKARGELATLRTAARRGPGQDASALPMIFAAVPEHLGSRGETLSRFEEAAFYALTLHAEHASGAGSGGHRTGSSLGAAVCRVADRRGATSIERRFQSALTATSVTELVVHLRPLVRMMRQAGIDLDFAKLGDDIARWGEADQRTKVRIRWARDYARTPQYDIQNDDSTTTEEN